MAAPRVHDVELVPLHELRPHPRNYRQHPEEQLVHLAQSLREHGLYRNVVVAQDGTILAGHGVVAAAPEAGLSEIGVVRLPLGPEDPRALKLLAADNELPRLADDDDDALAQLLSEIRDDDAAGLLGTGYDDGELTALVARLSLPEPGDADTGEDGTGVCAVIIDCSTEVEQRSLIDRLTAEGLVCRALI
jgi:ParB-like chromosome segregation protein Spo0J